MDIQVITKKMRDTVFKYKYAAIILVIGICFLLVPQRTKTEQTPALAQTEKTQTFETDDLVSILQSIEGAGKVKVLLSVDKGEQTVYQMNSDNTASADNSSSRYEAVIVTDSEKAEVGLITQVNPPQYLGAIVVCQGADSPSVKYAVTQAVAKITGLGADDICVLKME